VRAGDTVAAHCTVTKLIEEKKFIELQTQCMVGDKIVIDGEATIMVPSRIK
jgi:3-hydroxybutyryl-CoA dehydratase